MVKCRVTYSMELSRGSVAQCIPVLSVKWLRKLFRYCLQFFLLSFLAQVKQASQICQPLTHIGISLIQTGSYELKTFSNKVREIILGRRSTCLHRQSYYSVVSNWPTFNAVIEVLIKIRALFYPKLTSWLYSLTKKDRIKVGHRVCYPPWCK